MYMTFATNIAEHNVYGFTPDRPSAYWAVGTAAIYAAAFLVFGTGSVAAVILTNLVSSLCAVWLLHDLGRRWFGEAVGRLAALIFALWPLTIEFVTIPASELHFIALTLGLLACWDRTGVGLRGIGFLLAAGMLCAAAVYVRPVALLVPAALAFAAFLKSPRRSAGALGKALAVTALAYILVLPWSIRNERVFGEPVFMSTNFWPNFWMGNHPGTDGGYTPLPPETGSMSEIARSDYLKRLSLEALHADPAGLVRRILWKAVQLHDRETIGVVWNRISITWRAGPVGVPALKLISTAYWYTVLVTALAGIVVLARRQSWLVALLSPPVWLWLYFTGVHAVIVVGDRYHMPAIPMIALLAALAFSPRDQNGTRVAAASTQASTARKQSRLMPSRKA